MDDALQVHGFLRRLSKSERLQLIRSYLEDGVTDGKVQTLIDLLSDPAYEMRVAAYQQLKTLGKSIMPSLTAVAAGSLVDQRFWSIKLLTDIGEEAIPFLHKCMASETETVIRSMIVDCLGRYKQVDSVPFLMPVLKDDEWSLRNKAYLALKGYGESIFSQLEAMATGDDNDYIYWGVKLLGAMGFRSHQLLYRLLRENSPQTKFLVAAALGESGDRRILELLVKGLHDPQWVMAKRASEALVQIGEPAVSVLAQSLGEFSPTTWIWPARTLVLLGNEGVLALTAFMASRDEAWLWEVREGLLELKDKLPLVVREITQASQPERLRFFGYSLIADAFSRNSISEQEILIAGLRDSAWVIRKQCADALGRGTSEVVELLRPQLSHAHAEEFFWLSEVLKRFEAGRLALSQLLVSQDRNKIGVVLSALRNQMPQSATASLIHCLQSEHWVIRKNAADGLIELGVHSLSQVVEALITTDEEQAFWLGKVLRSYTRQVWPHLLALIYQPGYPAWLAVKAMGIIGEPYFLPGLQEAIKEPDPMVALQGLVALKKIRPQEFQPASFGLLTSLSVRTHPELLDLLAGAEHLWLTGQLTSGLKHRSTAMVENCVIVAGHFRIKHLMEPIKQILRDGILPWPTVLESLLAMDCKEIKPYIVDKLKTESNPKLRAILFAGLWKMNGDGLENALETCAQIDSEDQKEFILQELFKSGPAMIPELIRILGHSNAKIRQLSAEVLMEFGTLAVSELKAAQMDNEPQRRFMAMKILKEMHQHES